MSTVEDSATEKDRVARIVALMTLRREVRELRRLAEKAKEEADAGEGRDNESAQANGSAPGDTSHE